MIKILKLQKAVIVIILGILALIAYRIMNDNNMSSGKYMLTLAGILFIAGALMFLYPILSARKVKEEDCVELDPEKQEEL